MRKILLALALASTLGGCATMQGLQTAYTLGTTSISNPITTTRLYEIEQTIKLTFVGLNTWRKLCVRGDLNAGCRDQIRSVQVYTRQVPFYLKELRGFVANNDQVNAWIVYNQITNSLAVIKSAAAASGTNLGS